MKQALLVLFAALLVCAVPLSALSHEGPHQKKDEGHEMGSSQQGFKEGSGSSVLEESGHESRKRGGHKTMESDPKMGEGSGGMKQRGGHNDSEYEEKSGKRPQEMKTKTHRMREGS